MQLLMETLNAFNHPAKKTSLSDCMRQYDAPQNTFNRDFYTLTLDKHPELNRPLIRMLNKLGIPSNQQGRYLRQHLTVHACLVELNEATKNKELAQFIKAIDEKKRARWKNVFLGGVLASLCGLLPFYVLQLTVLQQVLTVASLISGVGLVFTVAIAAYTAYDARMRSNVPFYQLFKDNFFSVVNSVLKIAAWSILAIAAVTTPLVSVFFVLADAMLVAREVGSLGYVYWHGRPEVNPQSSLRVQQTQVRELTDFELRKRTTWINFAAAIVMTGIIAAWCFAPGGIFLVAGALLAMGAVYLAKLYFINANENEMKNMLQNRFVEVEERANKPTTKPAFKIKQNVQNSARMHAALTAPRVKSKADKTIVIEMPPLQEEDICHNHKVPGLDNNSMFSHHTKHHDGHGGSDHAPGKRGK